MIEQFNRFTIEMTAAQARSCSHSGKCDDDVEELLKVPKIKQQLKKISAEDLIQELKEYGAWNVEELKDRKENEARIIWIAAGNIAESLVDCDKPDFPISYYQSADDMRDHLQVHNQAISQEEVIEILEYAAQLEEIIENMEF